MSAYKRGRGIPEIAARVTTRGELYRAIISVILDGLKWGDSLRGGARPRKRVALDICVIFLMKDNYLIN